MSYPPYYAVAFQSSASITPSPSFQETLRGRPLSVLVKRAMAVMMAVVEFPSDGTASGSTNDARVYVYCSGSSVLPLRVTSDLFAVVKCLVCHY